MHNQHQVTPQHLGIQFHTLFHKNKYYRTLFHYSSSPSIVILPHWRENQSILVSEIKQVLNFAVVFERRQSQFIISLRRLRF